MKKLKKKEKEYKEKKIKKIKFIRLKIIYMRCGLFTFLKKVISKILD